MMRDIKSRNIAERLFSTITANAFDSFYGEKAHCRVLCQPQQAEHKREPPQCGLHNSGSK